ncbi:endo-1,4-beta-xylanase [Sinomicrobium sp. M5D2P17]
MNRKRRIVSFLCICGLIAGVTAYKGVDTIAERNTLKEAYTGRFYIGTALNESQIAGKSADEMALVKKQFNAIVAENCMKSERIHPSEDTYDFSLPDKFVAFGEQNGMRINGHTLIWHSQAPEWFFEDENGNTVSRKVLIQRMKEHIHTVVGRYKGRVNTWDVVNEAVLDNGELRKSKFYLIIGEDYLKLAFKFAREADPEAELYYNDYSTTLPEKREGIVSMVKKLQKEGIKIDGIGMQGHVDLNTPTIEEFEKSILAFSELGVKVMITEFDMTVLPSPWEKTGAEVSAKFEYSKEMDPYQEGLPDSMTRTFDVRYAEFFKLFLKHEEKITRVTFWGVNDGNSWRNNWPVPGRTDYPLLFDRHNQPKSAIDSILGLIHNNK